MKWWLISDEDVKVIREALEVSAHKANKLRKKALHHLDSGLHITDAIPNNFKNQNDKSKEG